MSDTQPDPYRIAHNRQIAIWLLICCATIFAMIILGGVTRLTGSGLSMVQWKPIMGVLPPLNHAEWLNTFELYKQYPEYQLKNFAMTLDEFKSIFWFEYAHRLLGRSIGVIFFFPFLYFLLAKKVQRGLTPKLLFLFILGGLQGLMGWYMVKSGLVDDPHVSQYRLTAHLGLAIVIYAYMFWLALDLLSPGERDYYVDALSSKFALTISGLIFLTILSGGFVAGTRAGFAFNTFPLMDGRLIPVGLFELSPLWKNFFENIVTIQFNHRLLAITVFIATLALWVHTSKLKLDALSNTGRHLLIAALFLQVTLGISTLLLVVPVALAAAHQGGAVLLLTASVFVAHRLKSA